MTEASTPQNRAQTGTRSIGGRFSPGQTGNPGGRPKVRADFQARAREQVDEHVIDAWATEVRDRGPSWVRCSELLVAYAYGKPVTTIEATVANSDSPEWLNQLTAEEVLAIARGERPPDTKDRAP